MKNKVIELYPYAGSGIFQINNWKAKHYIQKDIRRKFKDCNDDEDFLSDCFDTEEQAWEDAYNKINL